MLYTSPITYYSTLDLWLDSNGLIVGSPSQEVKFLKTFSGLWLNCGSRDVKPLICHMISDDPVAKM